VPPLTFTVDPKGNAPVYRQIMDQIRYAIAGGFLAPGDQLPSIRELARDLVVNPMTVVKAYNELSHEGAVVLQHGRGAFVTATGHTLSLAAREQLLRKTLVQVAVEAVQLGIDGPTAARLLNEEIRNLKGTSHG
jgi:GntR family transcriptional regulator